MAIGLLVFLPFIQGIKNLDPLSSAICLETYVSIVGIIILTPIFFPEESREINEIVVSKPMSQSKVHIVRIMMGLILVLVLVSSFALILKYNNSIFPLIKYTLGAYASAIFLGAIGLFISALSGNTIFGYMASIGYLILNMMTKNKYVGNFYIMSMRSESFDEKYWLLGGSILLIILAIIVKHVKRLN